MWYFIRHNFYIDFAIITANTMSTTQSKLKEIALDLIGHDDQGIIIAQFSTKIAVSQFQFRPGKNCININPPQFHAHSTKPHNITGHLYKGHLVS